jgi:DNA-binding transcriptional regulator LsrR (DeoR family)
MAYMPFDLRELQEVAALYCEGMRKEDIALILSKDENDIQRMIENAEQMKYFEYRPYPTWSSLDPKVEDFVYNASLTTPLSNLFQDRIEGSLFPIIITPSPVSMFRTYEVDPKLNRGHYDDYREAERESTHIIARRAAQEIAKYIFDGKDHVIGLNYGYVVRETISNIRRIPNRPSGKITVVSLFGDLEFNMPELNESPVHSTDVNCNNLVSQLAQQLGVCAEAVPLSVPGFIPERFARNVDTLNEIRNFLTSHASYRRIFGSPPAGDPESPRETHGISNQQSDAKIAHMDTIITGFGSADSYTGLYGFIRAWLSEDEIEKLTKYCQEGKIVGDLGGHLVASEEAKRDSRLKGFLLNINSRIPAAQPSDFIEVASKPRKIANTAGVVGITAGARKANILYTLLSRDPCPISRLIIDTHCALALLNLVAPTEFKRFVTGNNKQLIEGSEQWSADTRRLIPV